MSNSAGITEVNPDYREMLEDWIQCRDCYAGSRRIKSKGTTYLPATSGMRADGMDNPNQAGSRDYQAYKTRAYFPNFYREAVVTAIGMMHSEPPKIEMPSALREIRSSRGETMDQLLRRINEEQLKVGRIGLMLDLPTEGGSLPYVTTYAAERIINWDDGGVSEVTPNSLNLVVLDEREYARTKFGFSWDVEERYRVLTIGELEDNEVSAVYHQGVFSDQDLKIFSEDRMMTPSFMGKTLDYVPFVFVNSQDLVTETDNPPLMDLSELCLTIYRGEADLRQSLFAQSQDTLVISGGTEDDEDGAIRTGSGSVIYVPLQGDAKYIGVTSEGLSEQRMNLQEDRKRAGSMGAQSIDTVSRERESGTSLNVRMGARTASLNQIAITGAAGLEKILRMAADWIGSNPDEVVVTPNQEFGEFPLTGQSMVEMQTAKGLGFPISRRSLHGIARDKGLTKLSLEEEDQEIANEPPLPTDTGGESE